MATDEREDGMGSGLQTGGSGGGLQSEMFHPEDKREVGDTNRELLGGRFDIHPVVFPVSSAMIVLFVALTLLFPTQAGNVFAATQAFVSETFGWLFILAANLFIITVLYFAFSKYGKIRIGGVEAEKEFSDFSWMAMLFSAGMGIGLMFFSATEPMYYLQSVPPYFAGSGIEAGTPAAAGAAMAQTFFHWGLHPWAIYTLVGLGLAFFSFNRGLPLTFRSIFWPLLGERIYGWPGHVIDILSVFATLFGLATSLGLGVSQVNAGLSYVAGDMLGLASIPIGTLPQVLLIAVITLIATASVAAGLDGGVKRLSTLNLYIMFALLGFLLIVGPTLYILGALATGTGMYLTSLPGLSFFTGAFTGGSEAASFMSSWTIFYWAWWISWSPFVGMFIARISKGRTVRQFVLGVLILPTMFSFVWLATFGGSSLFAQFGGGNLLQVLGGENGGTTMMFAMFSQYPVGAVTGLIATLLVITFFVTSSDSGSLVVDHLTSGGKHDVPRAQRIFWALTEGAVAAVLLVGGGLSALQAASIATGLPFAVILVVMCYTVYLGLDHELEILESDAFADRLDELRREEEVDVVTSDEGVVTDVRDDSAVSDD
ncbi:glycine/betaine ABC transporter [Halobacteriales archaeon QS_3_64_16]|nr:MAG: glycine/betaine ABC transporter [Halobacteriales archaeon QS_3_64_16]